MAKKTSSAKKSSASAPAKKTTRSARTSSTVASARTTSSRRKAVRKASTNTPMVETVGVSAVNTPAAVMPKFHLKRSYIIAVIAAIIVLLVVYTIRSWFVAALVNGQPISRLSVINELEQQNGDQALQSLVTQTLIQQEASKRHITISQNDVNAQIKTIQSNLSKQGQSLSSALQAQHMTQSQLEDQIRLQLMVEKMVGPVTVTNKQVQDYMSQNKSSLPQGTTPSQVQQQLQQQNLQQKEQNFVSSLQSKAHITYWVNY